MKVCVVAGGAGFLGSNLCKKLLSMGNKVICLDNLYTGRRENIECLEDNDLFRFILWDITEKMTDEILKEHGIKKVDEIYNAACPASPIHYQKSPTFTTKTCILGVLNLLDLAKKMDATMMQFSTSEVYGEPECSPQKESYRGNVNPIGIRACYDEGKRCAEALCFDYHREFKTKIKVIRIFNTYGPNMDPEDGRVVSNFIVQALKNEPLSVYGDGSQSRSFCYVGDLIEAIVRVMQTEDEFVGPINLGNPGEYTMLELADKILELTGSHAAIKFEPLPLDDPTHRCPEISLAKEILKWEPKIELNDGITKTIEYFKELLFES